MDDTSDLDASELQPGHSKWLAQDTTSALDSSSVGHRLQAPGSVLALVIDQDYIFAGLQGGDIVAWSLDTYKLVLSVRAHQESVLGLYLSEDGKLLFSSGGDSTVNVWSTKTFERLYSIESHHDVGDIFTVVYSSTLRTVYCGSQNTSLQWCDLLHANPLVQASHKFFDSKGPGGVESPKPYLVQGADACTQDGQKLSFRKDQHKLFAHNGYVYCMLLVRGLVECPNREALLTGSGDGCVKVWELGVNPGASPKEIASLHNQDESVLSIAVEGSFLYCGLSGGTVNVWNLESRQIIKSLSGHTGDVWTINIVKGIIITGNSDGVAKKFNSRFEEISSWTAHNGIMLASAAANRKDRTIIATGGNDSSVAIWDLMDDATESHTIPAVGNDEMVNNLAKFIGYKTISSRPKFSGECNQGATFLRRLCNYLGAETKLLKTGDNTNPVVFAKFRAVSREPCNKKSILFYGHYDVVGADSNNAKWNTDPFQLTSLNGYLYGRGVSDNKGPSLAALYAAAELFQRKQLGCDVTFLIEGEEESGSQGFARVVQENKSLIGNIDWILLANSYWLDDHIPCLTYGLRGVIHANLIVTSRQPDLHSGIDGSSLLDEPLKDLTLLLGTLVGTKGTISLPNFHDPVLPLTPVEKARYDAIAEALLPHHPEIKDFESFTNSLMHRWREPSLTIHSVEVPGCKVSTTTISRRAKAALSIRIVPNQDADRISEDLINYAQARFAELDSQNTLTVEITGKADPWLGDPDNDLFETLSRAVSSAWSTDNEGRHHNYPKLDQSQSSDHRGLLRSPSSDSIGPRIDRIIASSSSTPKSATVSSDKSKLTSIPTSSTLVDKSSNLKPSPPTDSGASTPANGLGDSQNTNASKLEQTAADEKSQQQQQGQQSQSETQGHTLKPIYIREGGSIPTIRFLEKELSAPAAQFPCGQASDNAHLDNERLRIENLYQSREIFKSVFSGK